MRPRLAALVLVLGLAGCGGLRYPGKPIVWLGLSPALGTSTPPSRGPVVEMERFATSERFRTTRLAVLLGDGRWTFLRTYRWRAEPGPLVADWVREALTRGGLVRAVLPAPALVAPDLRLSGTVEALYWDRDAGRAVLTVTVALVDAGNRLVLFRTFRSRRPVEKEGVEGFLGAATRCLEDVLDGIGEALGQRLETRETPRSSSILRAADPRPQPSTIYGP